MSQVINPWFARIVVRYPDGSQILRHTDEKHPRFGKFMGKWADQTPLMGCDDDPCRESVSYFETAEEVAECLRQGGEGPAVESALAAGANV